MEGMIWVFRGEVDGENHCLGHATQWQIQVIHGDCGIVHFPLLSSRCYGPTLRDYISMDLVNFYLFILSYLSDFELWGDSLWELTYLTPFTISQTCVCLMANLVLLNLTLFLTVHFCAVHGYAATHMHPPHVMLPFHSATAMWLYHVFNLCYACPRPYW